MASSIPPLILAPARDTRPPSQDLLAKASFLPIDTEPSTSPAFFKEGKCAHCWTRYCTDKVPPIDEDFFNTKTLSSDCTVVPRTHTRRLCSYTHTTDGLYVIRPITGSPVGHSHHDG
ncbi:hypothetical protein EDD85DRAFT_1029788 [Armillaria nabsnona]|nr:hypothetical protein EDD85DRAFT_1029788 [Armillaria nabsnona]